VNAKLLDLVSVNYPLLITPAGKFLPVIGVTVIGDVNSPIPYTKGAISVDPRTGFKIKERTDDISTYQTTLKLREIGVSASDGGLGFIETEDGAWIETETGSILFKE